MAPCCFGSTVATHHSPAADEIREDVRARVAQGATAHDPLLVPSNPAVMMQPHLHRLCEPYIGKERESNERPVEMRERRKAERRTQR
jgi:hypothetical protein